MFLTRNYFVHPDPFFKGCYRIFLLGVHRCFLLGSPLHRFGFRFVTLFVMPKMATKNPPNLCAYSIGRSHQLALFLLFHQSFNSRCFDRSIQHFSVIPMKNGNGIRRSFHSFLILEIIKILVRHDIYRTA